MNVQASNWDEAPAEELQELAEIRERYRRERDRRVQPDRPRRYQRAARGFGYYVTDPYTPRTERDPVNDHVEVLVIGCGFGGLLTGAALSDAGFASIRMMDEAGDVGGTWYWNRYPGIHCDIEASVYMPLLEEVGTVPTRRYAPGKEIREHAVALARRFDLYRDTLFHTRATELRWDAADAVWNVATDRGDHFTARYVIASSGTLSEPKLPAIPGIEDFRGHTFHTSRWDYGYTGGDQFGGLTGLADKKVAVVGTGATGVQVIPHLGRDAQQLFVFQRTPSTIDVRANRSLDPDWTTGLEPGWQAKRMDNFLRILSGEEVEEDLIQDGWTSTARLQRQMISGSVDAQIPAAERELRDELADMLKMNELRARVDEVVTDPATAAILKPWYRYMCKRPCFSDEYLQTFNRTNVTLVDTADFGGITGVTENAVLVGEDAYEVDCIIFATGFEVGVSGVVSGTLPVYGREQTLLEAWKEGPQTLHGFYNNGFPNLFHLSTFQSANSVNFVHILQEQAVHIAAVLERARQTCAAYVEPTADAVADWGRVIAEVSQDHQRFQAECTPGYYNGEGRPPAKNTSYSPGAVAFHRVLRDWRSGDMSEVLVQREAAALSS